MRIVTYNFLGGGSARRSGHWQLLRERFAPDILLAQECRPPPADHPRAAGLWTKAVTRGWGTGVYLARGTIQRIRIPGFARWVVGGQLDRAAWISKRPLRIFSIHCPSGADGYVKTMGLILDRLVEIARGADLVLGGDFNVAAGFRSSTDSIRMTRAERQLLDRVADEFALIPCWQAMHANLPLAQTLRWGPKPQTPYHCDGIFVPAAWRPRLESCEVAQGPEWCSLSDHNPVIAILKTQARYRPEATRPVIAT